MTDKIQQARRATFREIFANAPYEFCMARYAEDNNSWPGNYVAYHVECAWKAFNAALDCVVIELPTERVKRPGFVHETLEDSAHNNCRELCIDAIESTNLGIKVK